MGTRSDVLGMIAAGWIIGIALPPRAAAEISDEDFKALKNQVQQLSDKVQKLEQTHEQDQQTHGEDQQRIQQLEQQLGKTQQTAADAQQKAQAAARMQRKLQQQVTETQKTATEAEQKAVAQVQPVAPVPPESLATHNVTLVGDAEIQFGKVQGQHSTFRGHSSFCKKLYA
jgi:Mg2+ and Co2+ transporter CorA